MTAKLLPAALLLAFAAACAALPAHAAAKSAKASADAARLSRIAASAKVRQDLLVVRSGRHGLRRLAVARAEPAPVFWPVGRPARADDPLDLKSSVALVLDQDTNEVLLNKNSKAVLPIASITKLMTGLLVSEANLPMDEVLTITDEDIDTEKGSRRVCAPARS